MTAQLTPQAQGVLQNFAQSLLQWRVGSDKKGSLLSKAHFHDHENDPDRRLYSLTGKPAKFLQYEEQNWGINLGWTPDASRQTQQRVSRWFFTRQNGTGQPVLYGETIAIGYGTGRSFLKYEGRPRGINLDWSNPPVFEWQILGGPGSAGKPVQLNAPVAIRNTKVDRFFVHFNRNLGGDIGWDDSRRWEDQLGQQIVDALKKWGEDVVRKVLVDILS